MIHIANNPVYLLIAFLIFYYLVADPFFGFDLIKSILLFILLYFVYVNYGDRIMSKFNKNGFGRRR